MKTLHLTTHDGTAKNLNNVFQYLNMLVNLNTINPKWPLYINKIQADELWFKNQEYFNQYECIVVTDTCMLARPFLQNLDKHSLKIIIYITNRFDWGIWGFKDEDFINTYSSASKHKNVIFCADNRYDQYYASLHNIKFFNNDLIRLTPLVNFSDNINSNNKLFIYDRGSKLYSYEKYLQESNIEYDVYAKEKGKPYKDQNHILEYKAFFHLPYQVNIQSLWENIGYGITYVIPSKKFITELIFNTDWYYWEEKVKAKDICLKSIELAEWYQPENEHLFIYFDNWNELKDKFNTKINRKDMYDYITKSNIDQLEKWKEIFEYLFSL